MDSKPADRDFVNYWRARLPKLPEGRYWKRTGEYTLEAHLFRSNAGYPASSIVIEYNVKTNQYILHRWKPISKTIMFESPPFTDFDSAVTYARLMYA
jgi:hypothetical protein